jgi:hypothetical protein
MDSQSPGSRKTSFADDVRERLAAPRLGKSRSCRSSSVSKSRAACQDGSRPTGLGTRPDCLRRVRDNAAERPAEGRKLATVLFADLVGSTALAGAQDPERTRALLDRTRSLELAKRAEAAVDENLTTPCVHNARSLLLIALAAAYAGDEETSRHYERRAEDVVTEGYDAVLAAPRTWLALLRSEMENVRSARAVGPCADAARIHAADCGGASRRSCRAKGTGARRARRATSRPAGYLPRTIRASSARRRP